MSELVYPAPLRALDANDNPVAGAELRAFRADTTTPLTLYADSAGTTAHPVPLLADANGLFPSLYNTSSFGVRIDVNHPTTGSSLPGYPINRAIAFSTATGAAADVSFAPTADIAETNVQAAVERVQTNLSGSKTGLDAFLVSGTPGAAGTVGEWNGDGDLVAGPARSTNVDFTADTTSLATRGTIKSFADAGYEKKWTQLAVTPTTSGTAIDFTSIPSGVTEIEIWFMRVSVDSTDDLLVQIGTGGSPTTTGYEGGSGLAGATVRITASSGFPIYSAAATYSFSGKMEIFQIDANDWVASVASLANPTDGTSVAGGGSVTLAGALDNIRITSIAGSQAFDAGQLRVRYR